MLDLPGPLINNCLMVRNRSIAGTRMKPRLWIAVLRVVSAILATTTVSSMAWAATLGVPVPYTTIQDAIDAASPNDVILVAAGTYPETLNTRGRRLALRSESGPEVTVIDGQRKGSVIKMDGGGSISGFTIRNGFAASGGGIRIDGARSTLVTHNVIESNVAGLQFDSGRGGGIFAVNVIELTIADNTIRDNYSGYIGGGISLEGYGACEVRDNRIVSNACFVGGGGADVTDAAVRRNVIANNTAESFAAGLMVSGYDVQVDQNTIVYNHNFNAFAHGAGLLAGNVTSAIVVSRNIFAFNSGENRSGIGLQCAAGRGECNDAWDNDRAAYALGAQCDTTSGRNLSLDPMFCVSPPSDFHLSSNSPCAAEHSGGCGRLGARDVGCGSTSNQRNSWGFVKRRYR